jgi:hypothetical protein
MHDEELQRMNKSRMKWTGHVASMEEKRMWNGLICLRIESSIGRL